MDFGSAPDWIAAVAASVGATLVVAQIRHSVRVTAIDAARRFLDDSRDQWRKCQDTAGQSPFKPDAFRNELYGFIAQLELNVAALSEIDFPDRVENMIERTIVTFINEMIAASYDPYLKEVFSVRIMCPCLKDFCLQRHGLFDDGPRVMEALCIERYRYA